MKSRGSLAHGLFLVGFWPLAVGVGLWLAIGITPGLARALPGLHHTLHKWGGGEAGVVEVHARGLTFDRDRIVLPQRSATIRFLNDDPRDEHNIFIYDDAPDEPCERLGLPGRSSLTYECAHDTIFRSDTFLGPAIREFTIFPLTRFDDPDGEYVFRCEVHPGIMRGTLTIDPNLPGGDASFGATVARRIANASHAAQPGAIMGIEYAFSLIGFALALFLVRRAPRDRTARLLAFGVMGTAAVFNLQAHSIFGLTGRTGTMEDLHDLLHVAAGVAFVYAVILFPDGRIVPRVNAWWLRWPLRAFYAWATLVVLTISLFGGEQPHPAFFVSFYGLLVPIVGVVAQGYRHRRAATEEERGRSALLLRALAPSFGIGVLFILLQTTVWSDLGGQALRDLQSLTFHAFQPAFAFIPVAIFVGILRYRLWDIDVVVNKAILYGTLAALIGALYVGVVVGIGGTVGGQTGLSIAVTVLVAVAFEPVRARVQLVANRLVYGERASPYEVMSEFGHRVAGGRAADVLPRMAEAVARAVGATGVRVRLFLPQGEEIAPWPDAEAAASPVRVVAIEHQGRPVGEIALTKAPGDPVTRADERMLSTLSSPAGVALHNLRLAAELQERVDQISGQTRELAASRRRIVSAADAERSRLEREIHALVEEPLTGIGDLIERAEHAAGRSRKRTAALLEEAAAGANRVQETLRDLARGIFPPLLADRGLVPAVESQARKLGVPVVVRGERLPDRFDPHAEAAVYFCFAEALRSAGRAGLASPLDLDIATDDGWVVFAVRGHGAAGGPDVGAVDLQLMADRVEAVGGRLEVAAAGGATTLSGRVPARLAAARPAQPAAAQTSASRSGSNADFGT